MGIITGAVGSWLVPSMWAGHHSFSPHRARGSCTRGSANGMPPDVVLAHVSLWRAGRADGEKWFQNRLTYARCYTSAPIHTHYRGWETKYLIPCCLMQRRCHGWGELRDTCKVSIGKSGAKEHSNQKDSFSKDKGIWKDKIQLECQLCAIAISASYDTEDQFLPSVNTFRKTS